MKTRSKCPFAFALVISSALFFGIHAAATQSKQENKRYSPSSSRTPRPVKTTTTESDDIGHTNATSDIVGNKECPESDGFFPHPDQCDKYYVCNDGDVIEQKLCPDGMVFNDFSPAHEKCDLPFNIDCSQKPKRQDPKPTIHCPRLNGYFSHEDPKVCNKFYYCVDGQFNMITCPDGLVYSEKTGICSWPDEAKKKGCSSLDLFKFTCPSVDKTVGQQHPRYSDPEDCQFFYVCINGEIPRRSGCKLGQVFNEATTICDWPRNVPECSEWYKGVLTDEELAALENPPKPKPKENSTGTKRQKNKRPSTVQTEVPVTEQEQEQDYLRNK